MRREFLKAALVLFALAFAPVAPVAQAQAQPQLRLVRVVMLMRHGVRSPTHEPALKPAIAPDAWPGWEVPPGFLTPHGARAISLLAKFDRRWMAARSGCPDIAIYADVDERTVRTAKSSKK